MPRRLTNDLLLALLLAQVLGGLLGWAWPTAFAAPLYDVHRALGVAVILLIGWKQAISIASLKRRVRGRKWDRSIVWGSIGAVALIGTLALGLAWTLNLISVDLLWGYSPMNIHVALGIGLLPFVGWHMLKRKRQNTVSAPIASRRALLRVGSLSLATLVGWQAIERLAPAVRLISGSKPTTSFSANDFPAEIWLLDSVPSIDPSGWRLNVHTRQLSLAELLSSFPKQEVQAVLDCTSGWWSEQIWSGVGFLEVVRAAGVSTAAATTATITSITNHQIVLPVAELEQAILATHV